MRSETRFTLREVAPKVGAVLRYWYDFGDDWWHTIKVEKILDPDPAHEHPECIGGANACPPEDCGGIWGYYGILEAVADPENEEREELLEWLGEGFDPRHFDIDSANRSLRRMET